MQRLSPVLLPLYFKKNPNNQQKALLDEFFAALPVKDGDLYAKLNDRVRALTASKFQWDPRSTARLRSLQELRVRDDVIRR